ncbi:pilus assembly protein PilM [Caloramator sp. mosi_1]|uniref:pilus assembly protein PilM n=1 Tax=Caloramator sp. mosi_1 TaxID=3023090 RepID=UPI0023607B0A|nr:pilus assembly protein PilM [Caloramator sp. mosi_1]WDC83227.1 pilus assembly protein PilM [Caloramator sp. mosi_1]
MLEGLFNSLVIEINSSYIKVVEGKKGKKVKVLKLNEMLINEQNNGVIDSLDEAAILNLMNKYMIENKVSKYNVNIVLSGLTNLLVREVVIPNIPKDKIYSMLKIEAPQYFPVNIDRYILDYKVLEVLREGKTKKLKLLVFAVPKNVIDQVISVVNKLNLKINKIDIEPNVLAKLSFKLGIGKDESAMVLNVEKNFLTAVIVKNNIVQLTKTYPHDLSELTDENLKIDDYKLNEINDNVVKLIEFYKIKEREELNKVYILGDKAKFLHLERVLPSKTGSDVLSIENLDFVDGAEDLNKFIVPVATFI